MKKVYLVKEYADCGLVTDKLQAVIDTCAANGGGQIRFEAGTYTTATLELKSNIELYLDAGAIIRGADDCTLYSTRYFEESGVEFPGNRSSDRWYEALISAYNCENISIVGEGMIDGVDCFNPTGEAKFRGPHGLFFYGCNNVSLKGFSIVRCANYSIQFRYCGNMLLDGVKVYGGQDALHFEHSHDGICRNCDFRSGDDNIAGDENVNILIEDCKLNTPGGSMILLGCKHLRIRRVKFWGPGQYPALFTDDKRYSVPDTAISMVHRNMPKTEIMSDDWLIEDIEIENVECVLRQDRTKGNMNGYQGKVVIDGMRVLNYIQPITLLGTDGDPFDLTIKNASFYRRDNAPVEEAGFVLADNFNKLTLENIVVENCPKEDMIVASNINELSLKNVKVIEPIPEDAMKIESIGKETKETVAPEVTCAPYVIEEKHSLMTPKTQTEEFLGAKQYFA